MGINANHLRHSVVIPALKSIEMHSLAAENLVMGTAAQESHLEYLVQLGGGPALGIFQMEPATHDDIWDNYIRHRPGFAATLRATIEQDGRRITASRLVWDLRYAAIMCRIHYRRIRRPLPEAEDIHGLADYWKRYYNTHLGKGTAQEFVDNYRRVA